MKNFLYRFMAGRYGNDGLNQFLNILCLVFMVLALITRVSLLYYVALGLFIWFYCRMFSRNISARSVENYKYYVKTGRELLGLPPISGEGWERMAF